MSQRVFLLFSGSNDRAIFALARVFAQCHAPFATIAWKNSDPFLRSQYRAHVLAIREGNDLTLELLREWVGAARETHLDARFVLVPSSEYLNNFLQGLDATELEVLGCELPLVDAVMYAELTNKYSSTRWFAGKGIPVPRELADWDGSLPIVAKPHRNIGDDGSVRYPVLLYSVAERDSFLGREDRDAHFPQEFVRGESQYLLAYLARDGRTFTSSQKNIGQQAEGKSIVLARTAEFHRDPIALTALHALRVRGYHGFAMLEFIISRDGPRFIEMNPRPWGPLQLCADHDCGILEAFVGDWLHGDPLRHDTVRRQKPASARYLWIGGILKDQRAGRQVRWHGGALRGWLGVLRCLTSEIYFRRDSWKVFLDEVLGR